MDERRHPPGRPRAQRSRPQRREAEFELPTADTEGAGDASELAPATDGTVGSPGLNGEGVEELARAFQANAEALQGINEVHARLAESLERSDRSELVLQSTGALNDTFRNLTHVQRALLDEVKTKDKKGSGRLVPLMLIGLLVVFLGGIYAVVVALENRPAAPPSEARGLGAEDIEIAANKRMAIFQEGRNKGLEEGERERRRLRDAHDELRGQIQQLRGDLDESNKLVLTLEGKRAAFESEREVLADRIRELGHAKEASKALKERIQRIEADRIQLEARLEAAELEVERVRSDNLRLRTRMAAEMAGLPKEAIEALDDEDAGEGETKAEADQPVDLPKPDEKKDADPSTVPPPATMTPGDPKSTGPEPAKPGTATPGSVTPGTVTPGRETGDVPAAEGSDGRRTEDYIVRTPARRDSVRRVMNQLMGASASPGRPIWRVAGIGGLNSQYLADVTLRQYDAGGGLVQVVEAKKMFIAVDESARTVDLIVRDGKQTSRSGGEAALPEGGARIRLATGDALARMWRGSGLKMISVK